MEPYLKASKKEKKKGTGGWGETLINASHDIVSTEYETRMGIYKKM